MKVVVGNALPYANGSLHIGRVSSWLPGDVIARYHRAKGDNVVFVSGSDCHGELVLKKAHELDKSPNDVSDHYHKIFKENFKTLNFSFDNFVQTSGEYHKKTVLEFIKILDSKGLIYSKNVDVLYCDECGEEVLDRFVEDDIHKLCGERIITKSVDKLFFKLSTFETYLNSLLSKDLKWRDNAKRLTKKYLDEGLRDRVLSRDIDWGIEIPIDGFTDKKVFVWIEAVMGYMTASKSVIEGRGENFSDYWNNKEARVYFLHGKENIPFHTIIMPPIIAGVGNEDCNMRMLSSEHMDLEGKKFSSNRNWVVWLDDIIKNYDADTIRYYLLTHGAEKKSSNFTFRDLINTHNTELLGVHGNFINRTLSFIDKYYDGVIDKQRINIALENKTKEIFNIAAKGIENGDMRLATSAILELSKYANDYFDKEKPWILFRNDIKRGKEVIYNCAIVVLNLSNLLEPIIPKTAQNIKSMINYDGTSYDFQTLDKFEGSNIKFLFEKIDRKKAVYEVIKLKEQSKRG